MPMVWGDLLLLLFLLLSPLASCVPSLYFTGRGASILMSLSQALLWPGVRNIDVLKLGGGSGI